MPTTTEEIERQAQALFKKIQDVFPIQEEGLLSLLREELEDINQNNPNGYNLNKALSIIDDGKRKLEIYVFVLTLTLTLFYIAVASICLAALWHKIPNYVPFVGIGTAALGALSNFFGKVRNLFLQIKEKRLIS